MSFSTVLKEGVNASGKTVTMARVIGKFDAVYHWETYTDGDYSPREYWSYSGAYKAYKRLLKE